MENDSHKVKVLTPRELLIAQFRESLMKFLSYHVNEIPPQVMIGTLFHASVELFHINCKQPGWKSYMDELIQECVKNVEIMENKGEC